MSETKRKPNFFIDKINNLSLRQKLAIMQIFCVLLPLMATDSVVLSLIVKADRQATRQEMQNIADSVRYTISDSIENAVGLMQNIYSNRYVNEFMKSEFTSPLDYYNQYVEFVKDSLYPVSVSNSRYTTVIYGDNDGIINGGYFQRLEMAEGKQWYAELEQAEGEIAVFVDYADYGFNSQRVISLIRRMDYYHKRHEKSVVKLDLNYSAISRIIVNAKYSATLYICEGDTILFSNDGRGGLQVPFERMEPQLADSAGVHETMNVYGNTWDIYVMTPETKVRDIIWENLLLILGLVCINVLLPILLMWLINQSFIQRIRELDSVFGNVDADELKQLPEVRGNDEISALMASYNIMASRMNELIQTVYKNRLKSQEIDIARQRAELLALHSQINPHFLFNALESIRMHSVLKKEYETADMVQKLALMERQNVEWGDDFVRIREEIKFIEAYLELQKYRFGAKLTYEINVDENCNDYWLPKLTLVTFVENACVHGMEKKTSSSWVFVRIYVQDGELMIEVEDTGSGMPEERCRQFVDEMTNVRIEMLKENRHVGILNAALRLKMATDGRVRFEMDSEVGAGTMVTIAIPTEKVEQIGGKEE